MPEKQKYIMIHASKMIEAPVGYDEHGKNPKSWDQLSENVKMALIHGEVEDLVADDWDIITHHNIDTNEDPQPGSRGA